MAVNHNFRVKNGIEVGSGVIDFPSGSVMIRRANSSTDRIRITSGNILHDTDTTITGDLTVSGNFHITGDINQTSVTTLDVTDKVITVANNSGSSTAADGAGLVIEGPTSNASMLWDHGNQYLEFNKDIFTPGSVVIGTTSTKVGRMYNSSGVMTLEAYTTRQIKFGNQTNGEFVRIDADGDVAIGLAGAAPAAKLDVQGLIRARQGTSQDGVAKHYVWRPVGNSSSSGVRYVKICRVTASQSSRLKIELSGRNNSYGDTARPGMCTLVGQLNNDNNYDFTFYDFHPTTSSNGANAVLEIAQVDIDNNSTDIYVKINSFSELTATAIITNGTITPQANEGASLGFASAPTGYTAITTQKVILAQTSGNVSIGSDADGGYKLYVVGTFHPTGRITPGEHIIFGTTTGYIQHPSNSASNAWAYGVSGSGANPGVDRNKFGVHHYNGSAWSNPLTVSHDGTVSFTNYTFPAADGSNGQVLKTDGSGNLSFGAAGVTLSNGANNRVVTASSASSINGEANLQYDGNALDIYTGSIPVTDNHVGLTFRQTGTYSDGRYEHRFRKRDEGGGIPLYIDRTEGTANAHTQIIRFGTYSNHSEMFEVYGNMRADIGTFTGNKTSTLSTINLLAESNGSGAGIAFSDNGTPPTTTPDLSSAQRGHLTFYHSDTASFGSGASFRFETSESSLSVLADGKLLYKTGLYVKPGSGTGAGTLVIDSSRNITALTGAFSSKVAVMSSAVHASYDFYNNGTTYLNGSVIVDDILNVTGSNRSIKMNGNEVVTSAAGLKAYDALYVGSDTGSVQTPKKVLELSSNSGNSERGPWNPIVSSIRNSGYRLYPDEDFRDGVNEVAVYNNSGGGTVTITHEDATTNSGGAAPNSSGKVLRINHNGGTSSPGYGGFRLTIPSEDNHTFVQIFQAKLDAGREFIIAENAQGSNSRSYFLTDNGGTGKWEWYARVSHCGNSGTFSSGGHIYVAGGTAGFNWYLASCTVYDVTESHYGQINVGDGGQTQANIHIRKADNNTADHIAFYNGTTRIGEIGAMDGSWLRINQQTNKNIYTPRYIRADNGFFIDSTGKGINGDGTAIGLTGVTSSGTITFSGLSANNSEFTGVLIDTSNRLVTREFGSNAFNSTNFLTSYTETDTLDSVCDRGSTTNQGITAGNFETTAHITAGKNSGGVSLTVNDGYGNANVTFNHKSGVPEQATNCGRIVVNTDGTTAATMTFELKTNTGTAAVNTPSAMELTETGAFFPQYLYHLADTDTYIRYTDNRVRIVAGGTTKFDSNNTYLTSAVTSIAGTANEIDVSASTGAVTVGIVSNPTLSGNTTMTGTLAVNGNAVTMAGSNARVKYSVWTGTTYGIGMQNGITGGGINNNYAMTFQMNNDANRGFWFGDSSMGLNSHAMTINTEGKVNIASGLRVGFGENDTTIANASGIHVNGLLDVDDGIIALAGNVSAITQSGSILSLGDNEENDDVTVMNFKVSGSTALTFSGTDATFDGNLFVPQYVYHSGDTNTYMRFTADRVRLVSGGIEMIDCVEGGTDYVDIIDRVRVTAGGDMICEGDITAFTSTTVSDINHKENIEKIDNAIEKLNHLNGYTFNWKNNGKKSVGVIAQEVEKVLPDIVKVSELRDEGSHKTVDYNGLTGLLIEAVKEQQNLINRLEDRIKDLEKRNGE